MILRIKKSPHSSNLVSRVKAGKNGMKRSPKRSNTNSHRSSILSQSSLYDFSDGEEDSYTKLTLPGRNLTTKERLWHYLVESLQHASLITRKYFIRILKRAIPRWFSGNAICDNIQDSNPREIQQFQPAGHSGGHNKFHTVGPSQLRNGTPVNTSQNVNNFTPQKPSRSRSYSYAKENVKELEKEKYKLLLKQYTRESANEAAHPIYRDAQSQAQPTDNTPQIKRPLLTLNSLEYLQTRPFRKPPPTPINYGYTTENTYRYKPLTSANSLNNSLSSTFHNSMGDKFSDSWVQDMRASLEASKAEKKKKIEAYENIVLQQQKKREAKFAELERKMKEALNRKFKATEEEEEEPYFRELSPEMEQLVDEVLMTKVDRVLVEGFHLSISRKDMETLIGLAWLNDEIINFYMNMLMERSKTDGLPTTYAFNTFFYTKLLQGGHGPLRRWTRKIDIFSYDLILVPVHLDSHWCLAVIDFRTKQLKYYDSLGGKNNECLNALARYLQDESLDKKKTEYDMSGWTSVFVKDIPHQMNGSDCGMFALKYAEYISRDAKINFTQAHMPYFRRRMMYEILTKTLL